MTLERCFAITHCVANIPQSALKKKSSKYIFESIKLFLEENNKLSTDWNTINVKSFRAQMKKYEGGASMSSIHCYNKYLQCLAEDGKLTKFAVDKTRKKLLDEFLSSSVGKSSEVFQVNFESLDIKEEYKKIL